jgi:hypothetical protein
LKIRENTEIGLPTEPTHDIEHIQQVQETEVPTEPLPTATISDTSTTL